VEGFAKYTVPETPRELLLAGPTVNPRSPLLSLVPNEKPDDPASTVAKALRLFVSVSFPGYLGLQRNVIPLAEGIRELKVIA
jgi:hypothetical protein